MTRGMNVKKIGHYYLDRVMRAGAIGCEIVIKGKISGEKARSERFIAGYLKKCGEPAMRDVIKGVATALPKLGTIGITTHIMITHSDRRIIVERPQVAVEKMEAAQVEAEKVEAVAKPEAKTEAKTE